MLVRIAHFIGVTNLGDRAVDEFYARNYAVDVDPVVFLTGLALRVIMLCALSFLIYALWMSGLHAAALFGGVVLAAAEAADAGILYRRYRSSDRHRAPEAEQKT
jgi:hypothetical protein